MYICMYVCGYVCIYIYTHINICEGPYHLLRFGCRGCCFYKSESTESDCDNCVTPRAGQSSHSFDREYHIPLSESVTAVYPSQVVPPCTSTSRTTVTINQQQGHESNKLAFCSSLTTSTLVPNPIITDSYFLTVNGPVSNTYAKVTVI